MLQKALVPVDFTGGLDTKSNPLLVQPGKLLAAENLCVRGGTLEKRPGSVALSDAALAGGSVSGADALATFRGNLLRWTATGLWARASSQWTQKADAADVLPLEVRRESVAQGDATLANHSCATADGYTVYTWQVFNGVLAANEVRVTVVDAATGVQVYSDAVASSSGAQLPCVAGVPGALFLLYARGSILYLRRFDTANPAAGFAAEVAAAGSLYSTSIPAFDMVAKGANALVAWAQDGTFAGVYVGEVTAAFTSPNPPAVASVSTNISALSVGYDSAGAAYLFWRDGADIKYARRATTAVTTLTPSVLATGYDASLRRIGVSAGEATVSVFPEIVSSTHLGTAMAPGMEVQRGVVDSSGVVTPVSTFLHAKRLGGHPFTLNGRLLLPVLHTGPSEKEASVQPTAFAVDASTGAVAARMLEGVSSMGSVNLFSPFPPTRLARAMVTAEDEAALALGIRGRTSFGTGGVGFTPDDSGFGWHVAYAAADNTKEGLALVRLRAGSPGALARVEASDTLSVAGACPLIYDGAALSEAGFHLGPEGLVAKEEAGGAALTEGTRQWRAVYEWTDAEGNRYQSAPSPAVSLTLASGGGFVKVVVPTLQLTRHVSPRSGVKVALYMTEAGGTLCYRAEVKDNNPAVASLTFSTLLSDAELLFREVLYTQGGVLDALPPPAHRFSWVHGKRLFLGGLEDTQEFRYSQEFEKGEGLAFHDTLGGRIPPSGGELTAGASMDGKLILFSQRQTFASAGDGPNAAGQQNTFTEPQLVASDVGCTDWRSVVVTPLGVLFKSERGFYLLTRGLQAQPIGAEVAAYDADTITSAVLLPDEEEVRFTTAEGRTLVYHYGYGTWLVWTSHGGTDALVWGGRYTRAVGDRVLQESPGTWTDAGATYGILAQTAWLKVAGIQGAQRVWRALLVGRMASDATLSMTALYDYESVGVSAIPNAAVTQAAHPGGVFQLRHHLARQKCEAVSFVIQASSSGEGFALTNLTLEVGVKKGARKLPASRTA
jgi:hypothetical protein